MDENGWRAGASKFFLWQTSGGVYFGVSCWLLAITQSLMGPLNLWVTGGVAFVLAFLALVVAALVRSLPAPPLGPAMTDETEMRA